MRQRLKFLAGDVPFLGTAGRWVYGLIKAPGRIRDLHTLHRLSEERLSRLESRLELMSRTAGRFRDLPPEAQADDSSEPVQGR